MTDSPSAAPAGPGTPWGLLAVGLTVGLLSGVLLADRRAPPVPTPAQASPAAAPAPVAAADPSETARMIAALERFERSNTRVAEALERLERRGRAPAADPPPADPTPASPAPAASAPAPGTLVPGLPPEGVPLVKLWFGRRIRAEITDLEALVANPAMKLGNAAPPERVASAQVEWKARGTRLLDELEKLGHVGTELELARWLDTTGRGAAFPKAWELAELAAAERSAPK